MNDPHDAEAEIESGDRFSFGDNWATFLELVDEDRIAMAVGSLREHLGDLEGKSFVDVGSGSGLFSLAAHRLGAEVRSFDFDPASVACTAELRRRFGSDAPAWTVERGSALDADFLGSLGQFDVVYSWGVLHHTGDMWRALELVEGLVAPGGRLFISIYNDQGLASRFWTKIKYRYNHAGPVGRRLILDAARFRFRAQEEFWHLYGWARHGERLNREASRERGMDRERDLVDWVGGWPFEVAQPEEIFHFYRDRGYRLDELKTCGPGLGCNEFVFTRVLNDG